MPCPNPSVYEHSLRQYSLGGYTHFKNGFSACKQASTPFSRKLIVVPGAFLSSRLFANIFESTERH